MKEEFHPIIPESMMPAAKRTFVGKAGRVITATACIGITLLGSLPVQAGEKTEKTVITQTITNLCRCGKIERVAYGVYALAGNAASETDDLELLAKLVPAGVICGP